MDFPDRIKSLPSEQHDFLSYCLKAENCEVFFSELAPGTFISEHDHNVTVYNLVVEGSITVMIAGETKTFTVGQWNTIPAHVRHSLKTNETTRLIEFWFSQPIL